MQTIQSLASKNILRHYFIAQSQNIDTSFQKKSEKTIFMNKKEKFEKNIFFVVGNPWIISNKNLLVFLEKADAKEYIRRNELENTNVFQVTKPDLLREIEILHSKKDISKIFLYDAPPIKNVYSTDEFLGIIPLTLDIEQRKSPQLDTDKNASQEQSEKRWNGVLQMKEALNTFKKEDRRKIDERLSCENIHTLIDYLMKENYLDSSKVGEQLNIPDNVIREFCRDPRNNDYSKKIIVDLLKFFGLEQYLLAFKDQCKELHEEISRGQGGHQIDCYFLKKGSPSFEELFLLTNIQRVSFKDTYCNCYLYQLTLTSELREEPVRIRVTNPSPSTAGLKSPCIVGKYYAIDGLEIVKKEASNELEPKSKKFSKGRLEMLNEEKVIVINPDKVGRQSTLPIEVQYERQEKVLAHIKKEFNCTYAEAVKKGKRLAENEAILEMYFNYSNSGKSAAKEFPNKNGFHVKKLVSQLRYSFYDACDLMIALHSNAEKDEALAKLKTEESHMKKN